MCTHNSHVRKVGIFGTGSYVPDKILSNADLEKLVDTSDEWIQTRTGIKERRVKADGISTSDLALEAAKKALAAANMAPEEIELIVVSTVTSDNYFPSTACHVQRKLGAVNAAAFDVSAACSGFIYGITVGWNMVSSGAFNNVLVIGAECLSTLLDFTDRNSCILFGDGAGAVVLKETTGKHQILFSHLGAKGDVDVMIVPAGGSKLPTSHATVDERLHYIKIRGREVFKFAVNKMTELIEDAANHLNIPVSEINIIIPHQVNHRIIESAAEKLNYPMEKMFVNIHKYGNTSAASIPIALDEAHSSGRLKDGDVVVMAAFGAGLTWGSCAIRW
ncbi:MAG: ketoacyl-ACP synthase III [Planctomycetes bacterium]|nr:ketoacyl-ACP synthase III [Planctomycetota bacterium]